MLFKVSSDAFATDNVQRLLSKCASANDCDLRVSAIKDATPQRKLELTFTDARSQQTKQAPASFSADVWHQLALKHDSMFAKALKLYVDGEELISVSTDAVRNVNTTKIGLASNDGIFELEKTNDFAFDELYTFASAIGDNELTVYGVQRPSTTTTTPMMTAPPVTTKTAQTTTFFINASSLSKWPVHEVDAPISLLTLLLFSDSNLPFNLALGGGVVALVLIVLIIAVIYSRKHTLGLSSIA